MTNTIRSLVVLSGLLFSHLTYAQTTGTFSFTVTPVAHSGSWGSENVLAVWIQNSADNFIRTEFRYWGNGTDDHLPIWKANSSENTTDATTGATLSSYTTKAFSWDGTDLTGSPVPDGDYKVTIEECWSHGSNKVTKSFTFTKNESESHLTPEDDADFINVALDWVPSTTGIVTVEHSNDFSVFPNPTHDKINIDFQGNTQACNIFIVNILGQEVYSERKNQTYSGVKSIDMTAFKEGIYFVKVEINSTIQSTILELIK